MSKNKDRISALLKPFGLTNDEARVYVHLLKSKELSALNISKDLNITRTKVYAITDRLNKLGLVSLTGKRNAQRFMANSHKQLELLVKQRRSEVEMLESSLPTIFEQLASIELAKTSNSQIMNYTGIEGLKTVTWNSTRAKDTLRVFEMAQDMSAFLDFDFSEAARREFVRRGLKQSLQLTNSRRINPWTNISEFVDIWEARHINPGKLSLTTEILVYNDVVTMYQIEKDLPFCVEIYNPSLSLMIKNFFDYVWKDAQKMKIVDERGSARVTDEQ
ncbi:MAG: helix-turn-helix domain-containing protein [Candidatus Dojkabacteria bacterium]|nr:helix-turn-helix domain-containing protein [Candidatus Dojkabacteria bacterium]